MLAYVNNQKKIDLKEIKMDKHVCFYNGYLLLHRIVIFHKKWIYYDNSSHLGMTATMHWHKPIYKCVKNYGVYFGGLVQGSFAAHPAPWTLTRWLLTMIISDEWTSRNVNVNKQR